MDIFTSRGHKKSYYESLSIINKKNNNLKAASYLLSADKYLWRISKNHLSTNDIDFENIDSTHLTANGYLYYNAAKDLMTGSKKIGLDDLADKGAISCYSMKVIMTALSIIRKNPFEKCITKGDDDTND